MYTPIFSLFQPFHLPPKKGKLDGYILLPSHDDRRTHCIYKGARLATSAINGGCSIMYCCCCRLYVHVFDTSTAIWNASIELYVHRHQQFISSQSNISPKKNRIRHSLKIGKVLFLAALSLSNFSIDLPPSCFLYYIVFFSYCATERERERVLALLLLLCHT